MQKRFGALVYSPSDLIRYSALPYASWTDRWNAKAGPRRTKKRRGREARHEARRADRCSARNLGSDLFAKWSDAGKRRAERLSRAQVFASSPTLTPTVATLAFGIETI